MPTEEKDTQTWLREVEEREGKATKGPWDAPLKSLNDLIWVGRDGLRAIASAGRAQDRRFIAAARQDIPKLLALVRKQDAIIKEAKAALESFAEHDCAYGDGCPSFGTNHGACHGCMARYRLSRIQELSANE